MDENTKFDPNKAAEDFIKQFGFSKKLKELIDQKNDQRITFTLTGNLAIFGVSATTILSISNKEFGSAELILLLTAFVSLISALLNIWYMVRLKVRLNNFKESIDDVEKRAEHKLEKFFKLLRFVAYQAGIKDGKSTSLPGIENEVSGEKFIDELTNQVSFIPTMILESALTEIKMNAKQHISDPLQERYSTLKWFFDELSDKTKNTGLVLSSAFILSVLMIKFLIH